jgi:hypothetical protein
VNIETFLKKARTYFRPWPSKLMAEMVAEWLKDHEDLDLDELWKLVVHEFPAQYGQSLEPYHLARTYEKHRTVLERASGNYTDGNGNQFRKHIRIGHWDSGRWIPYLGDIQHLPGGVRAFLEAFPPGSPPGPDATARYLEEHLVAGVLIPSDKVRPAGDRQILQGLFEKASE